MTALSDEVGHRSGRARQVVPVGRARRDRRHVGRAVRDVGGVASKSAGENHREPPE